MTRLCVPITATHDEGVLRDARAAASAGADTLELRLDYLPGIDGQARRRLVRELRATGCEQIVTCRLATEGGPLQRTTNPLDTSS